MLKVNEIFKSIQGESTYAGLPCVFVRLAGCNLRCSYCDTAYAYYDGREMSGKEIFSKIKDYKIKLVEFTGGEPLLQKDIYPLISSLLDKGYKVLVETNGSISIAGLDRRAIVIMDIKTPESGMSEKMDFKNLNLLKEKDEVKFVVMNREDYSWAKGIIEKFGLIKKCHVLMSPAFGLVKPDTLASWILRDNLPVRLQLQIHKYIWKVGERKKVHLQKSC
ncbi:MAG: radical SAM protein [Nitrospirae bacterium]|nr:radical SAM protein [Nitrospirota bacterium]